MGVWSSISFCHFERRNGSKKTCSSTSGNSNPKQILNVDTDSFSISLLQEVKEFRIQESFFGNSTGILLPDGGQGETQECPTNFEYSMGGNLKFYKEHLKQDYLESKLSTVNNLRRQRNISVSDNDSDPEALRYSRKGPAPCTVDIITEDREAELSFDNYSSIYQPEFLLNIKSESLINKAPNNKTWDTKQVKETVDMKENKGDKTADNFTEIRERKLGIVHTLTPPETVYDIQDQDVFDYDDHDSFFGNGKNTKKEEIPRKQDDVLHRSELFTVEKKKLNIAESKSEKKEKVKKSAKSEILVQEKKMNKKPNKNILSVNDVISANVIETDVAEECSLRLNRHVAIIRDGTNWLEETEIENQSKSVESCKKAATEFYPESPIAEVNFFKTPCSTRHNSLESFSDLENCSEETDEKENHNKRKDDPSISNVQPQENYEKLPKEFQEMARRLSRKDHVTKSRPSLHQVSLLQNFSCSSSTCSTISPRSPSGRTLSRTPSYKMPKTPSLSRHHPATYVTQHTSSRSRPSSRVSSRATSPTRENLEGSSTHEFIEYSWRRETGLQHSWLSKWKDTSPREKSKNSKFIQQNTRVM